MRNLSLGVTFKDSDSWEDLEDKDRWFEELSSELSLLSEAPHLKEVYITFEASGGKRIKEDLDQAISVISRSITCVAVTAMIDPSLRFTDFQPCAYHDMLTKLKW